MRLEERNQQGASAEVQVRNHQDRNKGSGSEMDSKGQAGKIFKRRKGLVTKYVEMKETRAIPKFLMKHDG